AGAVLQAAATVTSTTSSATITHLAGKPFLLTVAEVILALGAIAILGTLFARVIRRIALRAGASKSVARVADQWTAVIMVVLAVAALAGLTGISSEFTTLTISGIAGLGVTLALQTTLSNVIAGILMLQDGVLRLGDDIEFSTIRGDVVKLSLRTTWVKRKDGTIIVVGNSNLASGPIINYTARERLEKRLQVEKKLQVFLERNLQSD
ncbi:MAG: mechanosensitive ion channel domain-containing protein, partial [Nitrososphaerales archaeon]